MYAKFVLKELKDIIKTVIKVASFISVRALKRFLSLDSLKMVYYSYFHSVITYGLIFGGGIPIIVTLFSDYKKELLESLWE